MRTNWISLCIQHCLWTVNNENQLNLSISITLSVNSEQWEPIESINKYNTVCEQWTMRTNWISLCIQHCLWTVNNDNQLNLLYIITLSVNSEQWEPIESIYNTVCEQWTMRTNWIYNTVCEQWTMRTNWIYNTVCEQWTMRTNWIYISFLSTAH